jgi:hypothetical protein
VFSNDAAVGAQPVCFVPTFENFAVVAKPYNDKQLKHKSECELHVYNLKLHVPQLSTAETSILHSLRQLLVLGNHDNLGAYQRGLLCCGYANGRHIPKSTPTDCSAKV